MSYRRDTSNFGLCITFVAYDIITPITFIPIIRSLKMIPSNDLVIFIFIFFIYIFAFDCHLFSVILEILSFMEYIYKYNIMF